MLGEEKRPLRVKSLGDHNHPALLEHRFARTTESRVRNPAKSMVMNFAGTPARTRSARIITGSL